MSPPRYARLASSIFVREHEPPLSPPTLEARAQAIDAVAMALSKRRRELQGRRGAAVLCAAAAVVAATWFGTHAARRSVPVANRASNGDDAVQIVAQSIGGAASVVVSGAQAPLAEGRAIPEGSRLVTPADGRATLAFSTGTSVTLGEGTDLTVGGEGQKRILRLASGRVDLHVAKLTGAARFLVDTADAEVEVRGTLFRVSLASSDPACGGGTTTRVSVTEGVVVVRRDGVESRVGAGEDWPAGCTQRPVNLPGAGGPAGAPPATSPMASANSTLPEQNRAYEKALAAKNHGETRAAIAAFDAFLSKYPAGQLAEGAEIERMRLLRSAGSGRAVSAAHQYLASYPNGYARDEAEAILAGAR